MKKVLIVVAVLVLASACGGGSSTPTSPPPIPPAPTTANLSGRVTETAPTTSTAVAGATLTVSDGSNAGKSATTDSGGNYSFTGLNRGGFTMSIAAGGYNSTGFPVDLTGDLTRNFNLAPSPRTLTETLTGSVSGGSPTCPIIVVRPCQSFSLPTHHSGTLSARLTWDNRNNDLDLEVWNATTRLANSNDVGGTEEFISTNVSPGTSYTLRVIYYSGSTVQPFQVAVTRPN